MNFRIVFLYTDIAVWALIASALLFFFFARKREQYRIAWRQLRTKKLPLICFGILLIYAVIGILDSFHIQKKMRDESGNLVYSEKGEPIYETEIISLLDVALWDLKENAEKTYSAPFATHSFTKENVELPDGSIIRDYPRLKYGGAHLENPENASVDIIFNALKGLLLGLAVGTVITALIVTLFVIVGKRGKRAKGQEGKEANCKLQNETRTGRRHATLVTQSAIKTGLWVGGFISCVVIVVCIVGILSSKYHVLGTDKVGQDVLYTALKSCRTGLIVGTVTTLIVTPLALIFGVSAGYFGKPVDDGVQYIYTTLASIPAILLIAAAMLIIQTGISKGQTLFAADKRLLWLCVVIGITRWTGLCRLIRGESLKLREVEYVQAAHAFGVNHWAIMFKHIVPNLMHIVLISVVLRFSGLVLVEAVLAYVGIGVAPSTASWGNMINAARLEISRDPIVWWNILAAFIFMFGLVLPANIFGDAVRDALDPRLRTE